jgi:hypothetical protein
MWRHHVGVVTWVLANGWIMVKNGNNGHRVS